MEDGRDELVLFGRESHLQFDLTVCVEPGKRSVGIFLLEEPIEAFSA